ncbi:glycosyltransferase family 2 protein [Silicimonas algicola]|uniref:Glycosyl transferase family 2 n=1 Tax=Silicimonas algicola TaxID=1826607 RepID=A0A316G5G8_9RHOB|nr:glycosyltransferase family 2 protein [Silicimonas algicola]AZQ68786.1 glycosyltransferase family 2 protein [Silicimonas algicola]PWK56134.1 glycosyl transferase family 2 [Silicimonas algicola]
MTVATRHVRSLRLGLLPVLGSVATPRGIVAALPAGTSSEALRQACPEVSGLRQIGRGILARLPHGTLDADPAEAELFAGRRTLVAIRNGETARAASDWLACHARETGADAALIVDRDPPGGSFASDIAALAPDLPVVVVTLSRPLGLADAPDARHPALAPGAPQRDLPPPDAWHAPLGELTLHELLHHRFLSRAAAVAFFDIGDLWLPDPDGSPFDRVLSDPSRILFLHGVETYPWRLRQGAVAPHADHIAVRRNERRWLTSWAAAPAGLPQDALWLPVRMMGAEATDARPAQFRRALGVTFAGVEVNRLVRKADLVEDPALVDWLAQAFPGHQPIRLPEKKTIPPRPASARVTVVTAMKNEGPFILDWIAHNRVLGVARHLVYTNDCADGTDRLLDALSEAGVTRRDNPFRETGGVPQHAAFRAAEDEAAVTSSDWLMTLDVDEYVNIHAGEGRLADLFAAAPEAHVLSMPWRLFGNADRHAYDDRPVTELFTRAAPAYAPRPLQAWAFKSLFRNEGLFRRLGVHRPKGLVGDTQGQIRWIDGAGRPLPPATWRAAWRMSKANWGYDLVTLNHYAVRTCESFLVKRERGRVNHTDRAQGLAYWFRMNHNAEEETSILRLSPRVEAEKARLLALPGVAEAHAGAVAWHSARAATLRADPANAALWEAITSPRMEKLSRMTTKFGAAVFLTGPGVIPDEIVARDPGEPFFWTTD